MALSRNTLNTEHFESSREHATSVFMDVGKTLYERQVFTGSILTLNTVLLFQPGVSSTVCGRRKLETTSIHCCITRTPRLTSQHITDLFVW